MVVEVVDSRRLTGANLHARSPGAVIELRFRSDSGDPRLELDELIGRWRRALGEGLASLGWAAKLHARSFGAGEELGAELMFTAAVDRLYAATELNEWALARASGELDEYRASARLAAIAETARREQDSRRGALELIAAAEARGVMWLIDDDQLSLGQFADAQIWPVGALPEVEAVDWSSFRRRPVALITGTNGKTTTTRLLARMLRADGRRVGNTATDGLYVDEQLVEAGDWTGPGGARMIMRNPEIEVALLEAARGGLLRRGVGVAWADVAVLTNIADDHLGEYGVFDLAGMAAAKGVATSVVGPSGRVILGADSPALLEWARGRELPAPIVWFSLEPNSPVLLDSLAAGGEVWTLVDGDLVRRSGSSTVSLGPVRAMPLCLGGWARHNVANALAAAAAARGLGVGDAAIEAALREFGAAPQDNPGRARVWFVPGRNAGKQVRVLIDFAHNLAGFAAIAELVRGYAGPTQPGPSICFGMAGDRSDDDLRRLGAALTQFEPSRVILREKPTYLRGREFGEVPALLEQGLREAGFEPRAIGRAANETASIQQAIAAGAELVVVLVHTEHEPVSRWLDAQGARLDSRGPERGPEA